MRASSAHENEEFHSLLKIFSCVDLLIVAVTVALLAETLVCCMNLLELHLCFLRIVWVLVRMPGEENIDELMSRGLIAFIYNMVGSA